MPSRPRRVIVAGDRQPLSGLRATAEGRARAEQLLLAAAAARRVEGTSVRGAAFLHELERPDPDPRTSPIDG